jgi:hypothetical protein
MRSGRIRQPLRMLLLPTRQGMDALSGRALKVALQNLGVMPDDFLSWVSLQLERWCADRLPSNELRGVVRAIVSASCTGASQDVTAYGTRLADGYFNIHSKLMDEHLMSHAEAVTFLSHAFLVAHLSSVEKLSAAQIANLLAQRDQRARFSRQSIDCALQALHVEPTLTLKQITALYHRDATQEPATFADADLFTAAEIVAVAGAKLGHPGDLLNALNTLSPSGVTSPFTPYLQILHYQCSIAEFFDHAVTDIYEFSPRGEKGNWLHGQYPDSIAGAGNPFLNNAKSVEVLNVSWVRAKKPKERPGAMALLSILQGLQAMGFFARRELARWIRLWLHRIIKVAGVTVIHIPATLDTDQAKKLFAKIAASNTATFGILEQRAVDVMAVNLHSGWRIRGVGDSVNATNLSRAKLGDCEFLNPTNKTLVAYESHGGKLTPLYVDEHLATIKKSIIRRIDELTATADLSDWSAKIIFVAHEIVGAINNTVIIEGLKIEIETITFDTFLKNSAVLNSGNFLDTLNKHLLAPLMEQRTPNEVRQRLLASIES